MWGVEAAGTEEADGYAAALTDEGGKRGVICAGSISAFAFGDTVCAGGIGEFEN